MNIVDELKKLTIEKKKIDDQIKEIKAKILKETNR